jgi:hypothetical protein
MKMYHLTVRPTNWSERERGVNWKAEDRMKRDVAENPELYDALAGE